KPGTASDKEKLDASLKVMNGQISALEAQLDVLDKIRERILASQFEQQARDLRSYEDLYKRQLTDAQDALKPLPIPLKHVKAAEAARVVQELFVGPKANSDRIRVTFDDRTNALFIQ